MFWAEKPSKNVVWDFFVGDDLTPGVITKDARTETSEDEEDATPFQKKNS